MDNKTYDLTYLLALAIGFGLAALILVWFMAMAWRISHQLKETNRLLGLLLHEQMRNRHKLDDSQPELLEK